MKCDLILIKVTNINIHRITCLELTVLHILQILTPHFSKLILKLRDLNILAGFVTSPIL